MLCWLKSYKILSLSPHLVSVLLCKSDGCQLVVLLHQVLVSEEVEGTFLVRLDRVLIVGTILVY